MSKWGMPYTIRKLKKRAFQQVKDYYIWMYDLGDTTPGRFRDSK